MEEFCRLWAVVGAAGLYPGFLGHQLLDGQTKRLKIDFPNSDGDRYLIDTN